MKMDKKEITRLLSICDKLGVRNSNGNMVNEKMKILVEEYELLSAFLKEFARLSAENTIKVEMPVIIKSTGKTGIVLQCYLGVVEEEFRHCLVEVMGMDGKKLEIPYDDVVPYTTGAQVLFKKDSEKK